MTTYTVREFSEVSRVNALAVIVIGLAFALLLGPRLIGLAGATPAIIFPLLLQVFCVYSISVATEVLVLKHLRTR